MAKRPREAERLPEGMPSPSPPVLGDVSADPLLQALARAIVRSVDQEPRLIARGNEGCIYSPAPPCLDGSRKTFSPTAVGKLAAMDDTFATEAAVLDRLSAIDPDHRFHVRFYGSCPTADRRDCPLEDEDEASEQADGQSEEQKSERADRQERVRGLLVMERAEPMRPSEYPRELLGPAIAQLWEGLEAMAAAGISYEDLHPGNLMIGEDGLWRIVDFGGCTLDVEPDRAREIHARELRILLEDHFAEEPVAQDWLVRLR
jgi:hypothetical protein